MDEELKRKRPSAMSWGSAGHRCARHCVSWNFEGLVTITPNKGAHVTGFSKEDLNDIYEIRSVMEGLCAKWAAKELLTEQIEELEEIVYLTEFHVSKGHMQIRCLNWIISFMRHYIRHPEARCWQDVLTDFHNYVQTGT